VKLELLNRALTAAALVALAITLGVWLTRSPLTASPAPDAAPAVPAKTHPARPTTPEPTVAPLPLSPVVTPRTVTTEVEISYEIAPLPPTSVVADPPAAKPAETPQSNRQPSGRRGWFRRR